MKVIFENRKQARKVRFVLWLSLFAALFALYGSWVIFTSYGLAEADGGVLKPFNVRLMLAGLIASLGIAFAGGMMLFSTLYLLRIERNGDQVLAHTMKPFGAGVITHQLNRTDFVQADYRSGRLVADVSVNAPWVRLRLKGRRLPLILDLQADTVKTTELKKLAAY